MRSIVICEKPSQARNVRDAVGDRYGKVMALRGHVIKLAEPEDVNPDWKQWGFQLLRPTSGFYPLNPDSSDGKGQLIKDIGEALQSADRVIIATDCDREGQGIGENVLRWFKYKGPVFRAIFNKEDPASLREAFEALRPNADFLSQYQAWVARAQVDQIANLSATRAATLALKPEGMKGAIGIGRVRTPTMAIVCRRQLEIDNFTPKTYWDLWVEVERNGETVRLHHKPGSSARIFAQAEAEKFLASMSGWRGSVVIDRESKRQKPPKFMDLPTLQIKAAQWGWSASKTLEIAQSLYETHKMTTYPRAESRYLPEVEAGNAPVMLAGLQTLELAPANYPEPEIRKGKGGCFSDKQLEGSSHHAIIPNVKTSDDWQAVYGRLNVDEKTLFDFIARNYLAAIGPDRLYERTEIALDFDNRKFATVGIVETDAGWRQVFSEPDEDDNLSESVQESG
ncbi:MAG: hypothetical protein CMH82_08990 [Nocardioides sp.]|nr:hypothetical protein [Nocardioides sp.]|tara:strand:+ start:2949 stop:4307 length:1359 start_codon:yes stop_codon:yes gene_type:complete